jgi:putative ABC transport system permease protein
MKALNKKLLRDLWRLKGQALAIAMVVMCGIATFVMTSTAMDSLTEAKNSYYERYRLADLFTNAKRAPLHVVEQIRQIDGVAVAYPRVQFAVTLDVRGLDEPASALVLSVPDFGDIPLNDLYIRKGRRPLPSENDRVLVSEAFANAHGFEPADTLKAVINGRMRTLTISGIVLSPEFVYSLAPGQLFPDDKRYGILWMNRRALEAATDMDGAFNSLVLSLSPDAKANGSQNDIMFAIDNLLEPYGGIDTITRKDQPSYWFVQNELTQLRTMGLWVPIIFLSVAAFLLNIVLGRQIQLERDQIGMLKALGYEDRQIALHYLGYALTIVFLGSALGTILGMVVGSSLLVLYTQYFHFPSLTYIFNANSLSLAMIVSLLAAVAATFNSVRKIVALPPAEAMQPAPPMMYKKSFLDRIGVFKLFSTTGRMIVRHLERRPSRAIMSIVGVSLSAAIFLSTIFMIDSMDQMLDVQYNIASREDVNLMFVEARSMRAMEDVRQMPGVLAVEPYRVVPARIKFGNKMHRGQITGITPEAKLKRMIDIDLKPIGMPSSGLMLSTKLAQILGVGRGDCLYVIGEPE